MSELAAPDVAPRDLSVSNTVDSEIAINRAVNGRIVCPTAGPGCTDITEHFAAWLRDAKTKDGCVMAFVQHTTASIVIQENIDNNVQLDLLDALHKIAPYEADYRHAFEGPDDMPGHIKGMLCDTSVTIPVTDGAMELGEFQAIYLIEHRIGGRKRTVRLQYIGS